MLFRTLGKQELERLVGMMMDAHEVVAPKKVGTSVEGKDLHQYLPVQSFDEIDLDYETTTHSAKTYFLPYKENLSTYEFEDGKWEQEISYRIMPRFLLGLHACDIHALLKLDKVLARDVFPSPYYVSRRQNTFVVGIDHDPCEGGFCHSLGTNSVTHGFDLFLTDLGDRYLVEIKSSRGYQLLGQARTNDVSDEDAQEYVRVRRRISEGFKDHVEVQDIPHLLDIEFDSDVWRKWGDKCLSCGSCAMSCPTCYCYGIQERVSQDWRHGNKTKQLYSCNLLDFAEVSGGRNFRPDRATRLKYRYYHQHRGFVESYDEPKCVGCNRCGKACLAGIEPAKVIRDLRMEEECG
ncbi:MAG: hydrogenase [Actinobacteria bacterium]|nr:MAG: hydrogenase [Actinomycetota bacterium]